MVEVLADTAVALPPLDRALAARLVARTRISRALADFRDLRAVDMDAVLDVLVGVSELSLALPEVVSMDINPLFACPEGAIVVDVRLQLRAGKTA
jgi:acetyltransferase